MFLNFIKKTQQLYKKNLASLKQNLHTQYKKIPIGSLRLSNSDNCYKIKA